MVKEQIVREWFAKGDNDIKDAEFLFRHKRALETNFYFESRYPLGYEVEYTKEEIKEALAQTKKLIKLI